MANGTTAHQNIASVKATCDGLECSPSHHSATSPIAHGGTRAVGHGVSETTRTLSKTGKNHTRGNPRGSKTDIGKKHLMHQKTHGR
jgi:hypothetical protein